MKFALGIEYDGAAFRGWQTQPGKGTVQDELEGALARIAGHPVPVVCAGRTDAGVHATGQVVHFETAANRPLSAWVRGVNTFLPPPVAVRWATPVEEDFHARFSAFGRCYRYLLINRAQRPGVWHGRAGWYHHALDETRMQEGARLLVGEHDFSAFRASNCGARTTVKRIDSITVTSRGEYIIIDVKGSGFLKNMIRIIVGTLVAVGRGALPVEVTASLLRSGNRSEAGVTAPPQGLCLVEVYY